MSEASHVSVVAHLRMTHLSALVTGTSTGTNAHEPRGNNLSSMRRALIKVAGTPADDINMNNLDPDDFLWEKLPG